MFSPRCVHPLDSIPPLIGLGCFTPSTTNRETRSLLLCRVGGRIEKERVHVKLVELLVIRSPYLYRRTSDLPYFTADFPPIFGPADRAANLVS